MKNMQIRIYPVGILLMIALIALAKLVMWS